MENQCDNCKGDGLVGVGDVPSDKQGPISKCEVCSGTGTVISSEPSEDVVPNEVPNDVTPEDEKKIEDEASSVE